MEKSIQFPRIIKYQKKVLNIDEYKYVIKEKKNPIKTFITDNRETSSDDFDNKNSDKENSDGEN